ncbi:Nipped-B protein [Schistosoma japonicum]|uniref:Nipped-B protein n=1 Tax=Schistosoma japonicum TaxID=6182 RepID=A0A4Z2CLP7_SCHJA|nr:Nipped-B protein [Schistosoma japonicum]
MGNYTSISDFSATAIHEIDGVSHVDPGPFEVEQEEDPIALLDRLSKSRQTSLPIVRDAIRTSRACVLLLTLKHFLKESYSITDRKIQRYSPTDSAKLWEKPLIRRTSIHFHPISCLKAAGMEIHKSHLRAIYSSQPSFMTDNKFLESSNPNIKEADTEEECLNEMRSLIRDYLDFRKLFLTIDPPGEEEVGPDGLNSSMHSTEPVIDDRLNVVSDISQLNKGHSLRMSLSPVQNRSSGDENDSDDSNAGGASRLMLAQSAPSRKRKAALHLHNSLKMVVNSSGDESESAEESEPSDPDH